MALVPNLGFEAQSASTLQLSVQSEQLELRNEEGGGGVDVGEGLLDSISSFVRFGVQYGIVVFLVVRIRWLH